MRGQGVLLLLTTCLLLGAVAQAEPAGSQRGGPPAVLQGLLAALEDPDDEVVATALMMLNEKVSTHPEVRERLQLFIHEPRLRGALKTQDGCLWRAALLTRVSLSEATPDEIADVFELLRQENSDVRKAAEQALGSMGEAAKESVPRLGELLKDENFVVRTAAARALGNMGEAAKEYAPRLVELLGDEYSGVRDAAAQALGRMGEAAKESAPRLVEMLRDRRTSIHWGAVQALGGMGEAAKESAPRLSELLRDENAPVRGAAATALGNMGEAAKEYAPHLAELLRDDRYDANDVARRAAVQALGRMGEAAKEYAPRIVELLRDEHRDVRKAAAEALGSMGEAAKESAPRIGELLRDKNPDVRQAAAEALGRMGEVAKEYAPRLGELLRDEAPDVRQAAADALGSRGEAAKEYAPRFGELLKDESFGVRRAAARALGSMGGAAKEYAPGLVELLEDEVPAVQDAAAQALRGMGEAAKESAPRLVELLRDKDPGGRLKAAELLGSMGEAAKEYAPHLVVAMLNTDDKTVYAPARDALVAMAPLDLQHVAALVVVAEQDPVHLPMGLVRAHMAGGGDPQVERALRWLGARETSVLPQELGLAEARETLRVFAELWPSTEKYPGLRGELARQIAYVVFLSQGRWTEEERPLLEGLEQSLRHSHPIHAERLHSAVASGERWRWMKRVGWSWAGHAGFWLLLILAYPRSAQVQALFFWNPWVRRILGFGYVGLLLTWVPFLRRRLLMPFHPSLLADADLERFEVGAYFERSEVLLVSTGRREALLKALPSLRGLAVLEGASGLGKSMFIRYLLRTSNHLAVYLTAERCKEGVLEAIQAKLEGHARDASFLQSIIYSGALDIYIDGLNEVAADTRTRIVQFVESKFHGNILLATQPMEWSPPAAARLYVLQPLTEEQISEFLLSREPLLDERARLRGEAYREACEHFLALALSPGQLGEIRQAMREVLSNPMDLTVVARMLAEGLSPDLFHLRRQQYELMARDYQKVNPAGFPLRAFSEEAYRMRLEDRATLPEEQFGQELLRMEAFKMVVCRQWRTPDGKAGHEWHFRHDKIHDFFIAQTFLGRDNPRPLEHMNDPRFRGVYFLLTKLLSPEEAKALQDHLVECAAETRDHTVSDEFVNLFKARRRTEQVWGAGGVSSAHTSRR